MGVRRGTREAQLSESDVSFEQLVRSRTVCRNFRPDLLPRHEVLALLDLARRTPSAGFTQGTTFLVLDTPSSVGRYWSTTLSDDARATFPWPGLLLAPVLVLPLAHPSHYLERYGEADKAATGLGDDEESWAVPYWTVDTSFAAMTLMLAAHDSGLGSLFFGIFDHTAAVKRAFAIPDDVLPIGTIALGHREGSDRPSRSAQHRSRKDVESVVHFERFRP